MYVYLCSTSYTLTKTHTQSVKLSPCNTQIVIKTSNYTRATITPAPSAQGGSPQLIYVACVSAVLTESLTRRTRDASVSSCSYCDKNISLASDCSRYHRSARLLEVKVSRHELISRMFVATDVCQVHWE